MDFSSYLNSVNICYIHVYASTISQLRRNLQANHLQALLQPLGKQVRGFYGTQGGSSLPQDTSVAVCTIEKANSLVNKLLEEGRLSEISMIVIDELHMVLYPLTFPLNSCTVCDTLNRRYELHQATCRTVRSFAFSDSPILRLVDSKLLKRWGYVREELQCMCRLVTKTVAIYLSYS